MRVALKDHLRQRGKIIEHQIPLGAEETRRAEQSRGAGTSEGNHVMTKYQTGPPNKIDRRRSKRLPVARLLQSEHLDTLIIPIERREERRPSPPPERRRSQNSYRNLLHAVFGDLPLLRWSTGRQARPSLADVHKRAS